MPDPKLQGIVEKMVAAGEPEENIALVIQHYKPQTQPTGPTPAFQDPNPINRIGRFVIDAVKAHPVQAGAIAGGILAAPMSAGASLIPAAAAAGLGAAGGAGLGSIANAAMGGTNGPRDAKGVAGTMLTEGALGAAGEGIGRGVSKIATVGGKMVYKAALRPSMPLQREFGDLAETGLREGVTVSGHGAEKVATKLDDSANLAKQMIQDARAAGAAPVQVKDVALKGGVRDINQRAAVRAGTGLSDERPIITGRIRSMQAANPNGIDLGKAQQMKGELQDLATKVYRAQDKGAPVLDLSADTNAALARGLRGQIAENADAVGVKGLHDVNARTQQLLGLRSAVEDATRRNIPGVGSIRSLLGDFMPSIASGAGIAAHRAGTAAPVPLSMSLKAALVAALGGE